jgi:hypothetical protein
MNEEIKEDRYEYNLLIQTRPCNRYGGKHNNVSDIALGLEGNEKKNLSAGHLTKVTPPSNCQLADH